MPPLPFSTVNRREALLKLRAWQQDLADLRRDLHRHRQKLGRLEDAARGLQILLPDEAAPEPIPQLEARP